MFECGTCDKVFPAGRRARDQHCEATGHSSGDDSGYRFSQYYGGWLCSWCDDVYLSEDGCREHMVEDHLYCCDCERSFMNYNNIKQHLNSSIHRGSTIKCPFCAATYTTAAGMTHHLERGSCPRAPQLNRDEIYRLVRSRDPNGVISKRYITWHESSTTSYLATERAWNGDGYECYFCHREFRSLASLNQHLNSPAHQEPLYHCPNVRCRADFKTLAAVINHLESETCGAMRFETVQSRIGDIVSGNRLLRF